MNTKSETRGEYFPLRCYNNHSSSLHLFAFHSHPSPPAHNHQSFFPLHSEMAFCKATPALPHHPWLEGITLYFLPDHNQGPYPVYEALQIQAYPTPATSRDSTLLIHLLPSHVLQGHHAVHLHWFLSFLERSLSSFTA